MRRHHQNILRKIKLMSFCELEAFYLWFVDTLIGKVTYFRKCGLCDTLVFLREFFRALKVYVRNSVSSILQNQNAHHAFEDYRVLQQLT